MKDNLPKEHIWSEDKRRIRNLLHSKRYSKVAIDEGALKHIDKYVEYVNAFIYDVDNSPFSSLHIGSLMRLYGDVEDDQIQYDFFSRINLVKLVSRLKGEELSSITVPVISLHRYLKKLDYSPQKTELIKSIFEEIDLKSYIESVNNNIRERWEKESKYGFTSKSDITLSSVIRTISVNLSKMSMLVDDKETKDFIRKNVSKSFSCIDFSLLGRLMESKKKNFGSVRGVAYMLKQTSFEDETREKILIDFLSEIDFKRLALSYNDAPAGNASLANFCSLYSITRKELSEKWKFFFENILFKFPFTLVSLKKQEYRKVIEKFPSIENKLKPYIILESDSIKLSVFDIKKENFDKEILDNILSYSGFNITHATLLFQRIPQVFKGEKNKRDRIISQFDFKVIGLRARGKKPKGVEQLFRRMSQLHLNKAQYIEFTEGLGKKECRRLFQDGCNNLFPIIKNCEFSERELKEWVGIDLNKFKI